MNNENDDKLICGRTARKYLNCSKADFEWLVSQGYIQACRDEQMRWKVSKNSVLEYVERSHSSGGSRLIINDNHYKEVVTRICNAKKSIKIMTADFKLFRLKSDDSHGNLNADGTPLINYLIEKAEKGVSVRIILSSPSKNVDEELAEYYRTIKFYPFSTKNCIRNHAKVVIIDDKIAYVGSANATKAGLGQHTKGNFEVGILTEDSGMITSLKTLFSKIWDGDFCDTCHRRNYCSEW